MEPIEKEMRKLWENANIPGLRTIEVTISSFMDDIYGFIHFEKDTCVSWTGMDNFFAIITKEKSMRERNEILFRNFKRVLHEENTIEKADSPVVDRALA